MPSIEELQILNHVLANKSTEAIDDLTEEHFPVHKDVFEFIKRFKKEYGNIPTIETVMNKFDSFEPIEVDSLDAVKEALKEDWLHRKFKPYLKEAATLIAEKKTVEAIQSIKHEATKMLKLIGSTTKGYSYIGQAEERGKRYLQIHGRDESQILGKSTGFIPLDVATNGIESGEGAVDYFLVFAPTNMGKTLITSFMLQAGWNSTRDYDFPAYFALEQKAIEIAHNWDNILGNVSRLALTRGTMTEEEKDRYIAFIDKIKKKKKDIMIYDIDSFGGRLPTVNEIRHIIESEGHTIFALDQLSKVIIPSHFGDLRQRLFTVSSEIRAMILDTGVPGYIVAQATRESAKRVKKDSTSTIEGEDIGEAYAIHQDASKGISVVKVSENTFRITVIKNRENSSGQSFLVRYDFNTGLVRVLNEERGEHFF